MISKIGIRQFAVEQAVAIMGTGTPQKDVVAKAAEIEAYVVGSTWYLQHIRNPFPDPQTYHADHSTCLAFA